MENRRLIAQFLKLTRSTKWELKGKVQLQFNNHHAQGMIRIGDRFYLSSVELIEKPVSYGESSPDGFDRSPGRGIGHLFVFDREGKLQHDLCLGEGDMYHPGGIDYDGEHIWVPVAEYRPHSRSIIYKVDPKSMKVGEAFRVNDHIGGAVREGRDGRLIGNSWGSRKFYVWTPDGEELLAQNNSSHFVDYQDGHYAGEGKMIASGIAELPNYAGGAGAPYELGGLALIDTNTLQTVHEVPVTELSPFGHVITRNPVFLESAGLQLRLYAVPDDDNGSLLIYEAAVPPDTRKK
ncbi:DUF6454 family protein [Paenibacillus hamazuiensis]|uniref:DUF6454 family protein n=1 Tax=Paenibacillus hamazuiensis TaxID=2936508 RepID=UPI00200FB4B4|nr:DUF6454 family protein [Paenibacillus hamazuiensis]